MLVTHTVINKEYFAEGSRPSKKTWMQLIIDGTVEGRILGDAVYINKYHFAANNVLVAQAPEAQQAIDLLMASA